jgi:drug/metabolite transporter (DMT)-like permease
MTMAISRAGVSELKGTLCVFAAALCWATSGVGGKYLFTTGVSPLVLVQARSAIAALLLGGVLLWRSPGLLRLAKRDIPLAVALGAVLGATQWTYFFAISKIHVAAAILLQYLAPVIVAVAGWLWLKDRPSVIKVLSIVLALVGCWYVVGGGELDAVLLNGAGVISGVASAFCFAGYSVISEKLMRGYTPWTASFYAFAGGALLLNLARGEGAFLTMAYTPEQWGIFLYIGLMGTAVPFTLFIIGINHVRASRATITGTSEPLLAGIFAWFFLGETMALPQLAGGAMTLLAILLLQVDRTGLEQSPENLRMIPVAVPDTKQD